MNERMQRVVRAVAGIIVLFILVTVVTGWWRDFRAAQPEPQPIPPSASASSTAEATKTADKKKSDAPSKTVLVLIDGLNMRAEPDGTRIRSLDKGDRLVFIKSQGGWYQVKASDKKVGWVSANPSYAKVEE